MLKLRDYQRASIDALYDYWSREPGSPLIVLPTGGGKSLVIASLVKELLADYPDMRILNVTHVKELLVQNYQELLGIWEFAPAGLFSAGLGRRDAHAQILFGGIQTIASKAALIGHVDLVLIDEAHLTPRKAETQYGKLLDGLRKTNPDLKLVGLTATPYRLGEGRLDEGEGALFDTICYEKPVGEMIGEGYLCRPISKAMETGYDLTGVGKVGGDYNQTRLQAAIDRSDVTARAVAEVMAYGEDRRAWLLFCSGVEHAYHVRDELRGRGIPTETVAGETPAEERARILADFKAGRIRAVTNNSVLTTGFNHPGIDLLAMMRPTLSTSLYVQMVGRGLRNAPGKDTCLVLDFAGNVRKHGPIDAVEPKPAGKGDGEAPVKLCPECDSLVHASARVCDDCGYEFPRETEEKIKAKADDAPILSTGDPVWRDVQKRRLHFHEKLGGTPSVRVEYTSGMTVYKSWVCPGHTGFAKTKADRWWAKHGGGRPFPKDAGEFLDRAGELLTTEAISVKPSGRYMEVVDERPGSEWAGADEVASTAPPMTYLDRMDGGVEDIEEIPF
ncbi:DEAD/DEAH box helicase family protein [Kaustia mangrovi]|uniref:DEAD/DEAH box helicase family protein n=1 Tax=Kaustia mangrovi TaxID=2593653 RepID=A0A7S8HCC3_9HYPH|nr:DEAD/DEAH box helicase [Kaustia mangrovi]QPC43470.1 DEAD/DEAH box helicase family protein [Kaustia mangrovi]